MAKSQKSEAKSVAKVQARDPFTAMRNEMSRLFGDAFGSLPTLSASSFWKGGNGFLAPSMDIKEKDGSYIVSAELPGVDAKDVEVEVDQGLLTIRGEKKEEKEEKDDKGYHLTERRYGAFSRSISLPQNADESSIDADVSNGVLTITIKKTAASAPKAKKIAVKSTK